MTGRAAQLRDRDRADAPPCTCVYLGAVRALTHPQCAVHGRGGTWKAIVPGAAQGHSSRRRAMRRGRYTYYHRQGFWWQRQWRIAAAFRWAKPVTWTLVVCLLALGLVTGINWLAQQPWGHSGGRTFWCDSGQHLLYQDIDRGQKTIVWCAP